MASGVFQHTFSGSRLNLEFEAETEVDWIDDPGCSNGPADNWAEPYRETDVLVRSVRFVPDGGEPVTLREDMTPAEAKQAVEILLGAVGLSLTEDADIEIADRMGPGNEPDYPEED